MHGIGTPEWNTSVAMIPSFAELPFDHDHLAILLNSGGVPEADPPKCIIYAEGTGGMVIRNSGAYRRRHAVSRPRFEQFLHYLDGEYLQCGEHEWGAKPEDAKFLLGDGVSLYTVSVRHSGVQFRANYMWTIGEGDILPEGQRDFLNRMNYLIWWA